MRPLLLLYVLLSLYEAHGCVELEPELAVFARIRFDAYRQMYSPDSVPLDMNMTYSLSKLAHIKATMIPAEPPAYSTCPLDARYKFYYSNNTEHPCCNPNDCGFDFLEGQYTDLTNFKFVIQKRECDNHTPFNFKLLEKDIDDLMSLPEAYIVILGRPNSSKWAIHLTKFENCHLVFVTADDSGDYSRKSPMCDAPVQDYMIKPSDKPVVLKDDLLKLLMYYEIRNTPYFQELKKQEILNLTSYDVLSEALKVASESLNISEPTKLQILQDRSDLEDLLNRLEGTTYESFLSAGYDFSIDFPDHCYTGRPEYSVFAKTRLDAYRQLYDSNARPLDDYMTYTLWMLARQKARRVPWVSKKDPNCLLDSKYQFKFDTRYESKCCGMDTCSKLFLNMALNPTDLTSFTYVVHERDCDEWNVPETYYLNTVERDIDNLMSLPEAYLRIIGRPNETKWGIFATDKKGSNCFIVFATAVDSGDHTRKSMQCDISKKMYRIIPSKSPVVLDDNLVQHIKDYEKSHNEDNFWPA